MAVGGILSVILDNLVPGTPEERGLIHWQVLEPAEEDKTTVKDLRVYDLPFGIGNHWKISQFLPFMPYYPDKKGNRKQEGVTIQLQEYRPTNDQENITS